MIDQERYETILSRCEEFLPTQGKELLRMFIMQCRTEGDISENVVNVDARFVRHHHFNDGMCRYYSGTPSPTEIPLYVGEVTDVHVGVMSVTHTKNNGYECRFIVSFIHKENGEVIDFDGNRGASSEDIRLLMDLSNFKEHDLYGDDEGQVR